MTNNETPQKVRKKSKIFAITVMVIMTSLLLFNILKSPTEFSELENRNLTQLNAPTFATIFNGEFMDNFSNYVTDQFAFRDFFVGIKANIERFMGKKGNNGVHFGYDNYLIQRTQGYNQKEIDENINAIKAMADTKRFNLSLSVVPSAFEVMQEKLPMNAYDNIYLRLMDSVNTGLEGVDVNIIDTHATLMEANNDYLYYRTDHHQTALGSYYVYRDVATGMKLCAYEYPAFEIKTIATDFYGTTYSKAPLINAKPDEISVFKLKENCPSYSVECPGDEYSLNGLYDEEKLKTKDKYAYYLGGNHPLTIVKSDCGTGAKLAIFKDSYSHSVAPFFANHYDEIHMIDLRYFTDDMVAYLLQNGIKDVLFLYSDDSFLSGSNLTKLGSFASMYKYVEPTYGRVPESEAVDAGFFADALFIGDSLTKGFRMCTDLPVKFLCWGGGGTTQVLSVPSKEDNVVIVDAAGADPDVNKFYIMLGLNEIAITDKAGYIERYTKIIKKLREAKPECQIYIQSMLPISRSCEAKTSLSMADINEANSLLEKMAEENQCFYLNIIECIVGGDGYLPEGAASDGIHFSAQYHAKWQNYLQTHTYMDPNLQIKPTVEFVLFPDGGEIDLLEISDQLQNEVKFVEKLNPVSDRIISSLYGINEGDAVNGIVLTSSGATAEEIAIFEVSSPQMKKSVKEKLYSRIEKKKGDFENYIPEEMGKLNSPLVAYSDNLVVMCLSDHNDDVEKVLKEFDLKID